MSKMTLEKKESLHSYLYLLPGTLVMLAFVLIPMFMSVYMSAFNITSLYGTWAFTGFGNYLSVLGDGRFWASLGRTVLFGVWGLAIGFSFGLLWSFMVARHRFLNLYRYIFYIPSVVSSITLARLWNYVFVPTDYGLANSILMGLGLVNSPVNWLGDDMITWLVLILAFYGAGGGMTLVLFTTAINNIDESMREVAKIEGASTLQTVFMVEIPLIRPVIVSYLILSIIGSFKAFENLYGLAPNSEGVETIAVFLYRNVSNSSMGYGYASAVGVVNTLIVMIIMEVYTRLPGGKSE